MDKKKILWEGQYSPRELEFLKALHDEKISKEELISWAIYEMKKTASQLEFSSNYHINNDSSRKDFLARAHILAEISEHLENLIGEDIDLSYYLKRNK